MPAAAESELRRSAIDREHARRRDEHGRNEDERRWYSRVATRSASGPTGTETERDCIKDNNRKLAAEIEEARAEIVPANLVPAAVRACRRRPVLRQPSLLLLRAHQDLSQHGCPPPCGRSAVATRIDCWDPSSRVVPIAIPTSVRDGIRCVDPCWTDFHHGQLVVPLPGLRPTP